MKYDASKVTPRPWARDLGSVTRKHPPWLIADCKASVDAAHIAHCVNAHEALVAALEELALEYDARIDTGVIASSDPASVALQKARAALALAKEEKG